MIFLKENIVFVKLFEASFGSDILASFTEFQCQCTDTLILFERKLLNFEAVCYIKNAWILL